jgi:hypothetical protein
MATCEKGSNRFINNGTTDHQTLHDVDKFFQKKMLLEFSTFFTQWRFLAAKPAELLVSN